MTANGWRSVRFAEIADYKAGRTPARARADYWGQGTGDGVPWVAISDMTEFGTVTETEERITDAALQQVFRGHKVHKGTLIMSFKLTIGRVATLGIDACHNEAIISIYPREGIDQRFLGYFLSQVDYDSLQDRQVKGNTLNQEKIDRIEVLLPPFGEQFQIAEVLDLLQRAARVERDILRTAAELKHTTLVSVFTRGLRGEPQKRSEIGATPASWKRIPIASLGRIITGTTPPTRDQKNYIGGDIPFVAPGDIEHGSEITATERFITAKGFNSTRPLRGPATCFVCIGSTIGKVGYITRPKCATNQQINSIESDSQFHPLFVFYLMTYWAGYIRKQASPSPVPILSKGAFERIEVFSSMDKKEQEEIAMILRTIDRKIDLHRRKLYVFEALFKTLLQNLMKGNVGVAELDLSALADGPTTETDA
ncbi:MAG: restriction endonuclease subunit S [Gemmatimonadaceae bacterium]